MTRANIDSGSYGNFFARQERLRSRTETLAADLTLTIDDPPLLFLDPGGSGRNVDLPSEATSDGLRFTLVNTADAAEIITVRDSGGSGLTPAITPTQNETAVLWCDGTTWRGTVSTGA